MGKLGYCDNEGNLKQHGQIKIDLKDKSSGQITHILSQAIGRVINIAVEKECPIVIEKLDFSSKKARLKENGKRYAKMLSQFAYSKFSDLVHSKARLAAIQIIEANPAYSSLIGMTKFMSLYALNSGTAASLVLARRGQRFSERLPRVCNALFAPVDVNKHVWSYWARISKLLKGCRRHSFFGMRVRVGVKPNNQSSPPYNPSYKEGYDCISPVRGDDRGVERKLLGKSSDTPVNLSGTSALLFTST